MDLIIKGSSELNKMLEALQRTASSLCREQQSLHDAQDFVQKASKLLKESLLSDLLLS